MGSQQFCLRWNNHQTNLVNVFEELLTDETLVDVTLACEGLCVRAHKVVLSACSPYFKEIFVHNPCKHPIVIMKDINFAEMRAIIEFMYKGEVNISHEQLPAFLKTAETLKVKGLAEVRNEQKSFAHEEESREVADEIEPTNNNNINNTNNNTPAPTPVVARSAPEVVNHPPPERNSPSPKRKRRNGRNVSESSESAKTSSKSSEAVEILPEIIKIEQDDNERDDEIPMVEEIARGVMGDSAQNKMANQEDSSNSFIQVDPADMPSFVTDQSWDDHSNSGNHLQPTAGGSGIQSTSQAIDHIMELDADRGLKLEFKRNEKMKEENATMTRGRCKDCAKPSKNQKSARVKCYSCDKFICRDHQHKQINCTSCYQLRRYKYTY